jgi:transcriptional regulator with XRE-family HTH domain
MPKQSLHEYVIAELEKAGSKHWRQISEDSGVNLSTLKKIARREVANPGVSFVEKLADYFQNQTA